MVQDFQALLSSCLPAHSEAVPTANPRRLTGAANRLILISDIGRLIWCALIGPFRSRAALQAEILILRHQLNVLRRKSPKRVSFSNIDRLVFAGLYRLGPRVLDALKILKPETVIRCSRVHPICGSTLITFLLIAILVCAGARLLSVRAIITELPALSKRPGGLSHVGRVARLHGGKSSAHAKERVARAGYACNARQC